ncbi:uncharacterized protein LOC135466779 [Liolophura sinensis]|uniref:uncharacterized protein LOC135466779 n=1 Tax=Liolophura sinensis TaxID=3198878 RepID=UPI0031597673
MERLQIWLGLKERESVLQIMPSETGDLSELQRPVMQKEDIKPLSSSPGKTLTSPGSGEDDHIAQTKQLSLTRPVDSVSETVTSIVKNKADCVTCRVIGSSVGAGAAGYVLYEGWKNRNMYTGFNRFCYRGCCLSLSTSLVVMSVSIAFKMGLYQEVEEGEKKDLASLLKKEYQTLKGKLSSLYHSSNSVK